MVSSRLIGRIFGPLLAGLASLISISAATNAADRRCPVGDFTIVDARVHEVDTICRAVEDAIMFMRAQGLEQRGPVTIRLVDSLTDTQVASAVGTYNGKTASVEVLTYEAALRLPPERPAFGMPMNSSLYRSFIVHEVAHAIVHPNFVRPPQVAAHEYIAYTAQLATMPEELRAAVLQNVDTDGFDHLKEVGDMLLAVDPNRFAVKSYLHFARDADGETTFYKLLSGWY